MKAETQTKDELQEHPDADLAEVRECDMQDGFSDVTTAQVHSSAVFEKEESFEATVEAETQTKDEFDEHDGKTLRPRLAEMRESEMQDGVSDIKAAQVQSSAESGREASIESEMETKSELDKEREEATQPLDSMFDFEHLEIDEIMVATKGSEDSTCEAVKLQLDDSQSPEKQTVVDPSSNQHSEGISDNAGGLYHRQCAHYTSLEW